MKSKVASTFYNFMIVFALCTLFADMPRKIVYGILASVFAVCLAIAHAVDT